MNDFKDRRYEKAHSILTDLISAIDTQIAFIVNTQKKGDELNINFLNYSKRQISMAKCWLREYEEAIITGGEVEDA